MSGPTTTPAIHVVDDRCRLEREQLRKEAGLSFPQDVMALSADRSALLYLIPDLAVSELVACTYPAHLTVDVNDLPGLTAIDGLWSFYIPTDDLVRDPDLVRDLAALFIAAGPTVFDMLLPFQTTQDYATGHTLPPPAADVRTFVTAISASFNNLDGSPTATTAQHLDDNHQDANHQDDNPPGQ